MIKVHFKKWEKERSLCGRVVAEGETFILVPFSKEHLPYYPPADGYWCASCLEKWPGRPVGKG